MKKEKILEMNSFNKTDTCIYYYLISSLIIHVLVTVHIMYSNLQFLDLDILVSMTC